MPKIRTGTLRAAVLASTAFVALALPAATCAQAVRTISAAEKAEGAKAHPQLVAEFGGAFSGPQTAYVEGIGKNIAIQSGLGNARSDFTVTLLNSPVNNAFAIPGGYVYVTRQLVALMNNEAELAGVLGHEVGHVAARHAAKRQSAAQRNSILGVLGQVASTILLGNSALGQLGQQLFSTGSQLLTLQYSRGQEIEADNLGIQYLARAGYDPRAMSTVLTSLAQQNALEARMQGSSNRVPEWASTHPDPASRVSAAANRASRTASSGLTNRDTFLTRIDGLMYDDDPVQGVVEGATFTHPQFRLAFQAPNGFYLVNSTRSVSINGQSGKGELSTAPYNGNMTSYIQSVLSGLTQGQQQIPIGQLQTTTVNGIPATYATSRVNASGGAVDVTVFAYQFSNTQAFHFLTITQAGRAAVFNPMYASMRRISASEAAAVKPRKVDVITAKAGDTVQTLAARMAYPTYKLERFLVLNQLTANSRLVAGQKVKIVTY